MKPVLISGFCSVKQMGHLSIAGKLPADAGTHLPTPGGWKAELA